MNFSATQILREIKFSESKTVKMAVMPTQNMPQLISRKWQKNSQILTLWFECVPHLLRTTNHYVFNFSII